MRAVRPTAESGTFSNTKHEVHLGLPVTVIHTSIRTVKCETAELSVATGRKIAYEIKFPSRILHYQLYQSHFEGIRRRGFWYNMSKYFVTDMPALKIGRYNVNRDSQY